MLANLKTNSGNFLGYIVIQSSGTSLKIPF